MALGYQHLLPGSKYTRGKFTPATTANRSMDMIYSMIHMFHEMNVSAQKSLREGVKAIEEEEMKHGSVILTHPWACAKIESLRSSIVQFSQQMEAMTQMISQGGMIGAGGSVFTLRLTIGMR